LTKVNGARKEKTSKLKQGQKTGAKKSNDKKSSSTHQAGIKIDTKERIAAANARLNGMDIVEYIESKMAENGSDSASEKNVANQSRKIINKTENLDQSYSVKRHIAESKKDAKISSILSKPTVFHTEGTPIEISRCTSLSDLTIDSEPKSMEFSALKGKLTQDPIAQVDGTKVENSCYMVWKKDDLDSQCNDQLEDAKKVSVAFYSQALVLL